MTDFDPTSALTDTEKAAIANERVRAWAADAFSKVAGTRYAVGSLCVTAQTAPNLAGMQGSHSLINAIAPRIAGTIGRSRQYR